MMEPRWLQQYCRNCVRNGKHRAYNVIVDRSPRYAAWALLCWLPRRLPHRGYSRQSWRNCLRIRASRTREYLRMAWSLSQVVGRGMVEFRDFAPIATVPSRPNPIPRDMNLWRVFEERDLSLERRYVGGTRRFAQQGRVEACRTPRHGQRSLVASRRVYPKHSISISVRTRILRAGCWPGGRIT